MKNGFTLAEVLIALVLIAAGMASLLMAFSSALGGARGTEEHETAVNIANAVMEDLMARTYASLSDYTADSSAVFSGLTGYTVTVTTTKPNNPAQVDVRVSWLVKGGTASVTLTTLAADR